MPGQVSVRSKENLQHEVIAGAHKWTVDEPVAAGGEGTGPDPYDMLLAALGSCTSMTLGLYARHKKWPLEDITVMLSHEKIHAKDCEDCETKEGKVDLIKREIRLTSPLSKEQIERLTEIADRCPVHQTLSGEIKIENTTHQTTGAPP